MGAACAVVHRVLALAPGTQDVLPHLGDWAIGVLTGDLGESTRYRIGASVTELLADTAAESLLVVGLALAFSVGGAGVLQCCPSQ